ncbi:phosphotransferase [Rubrobacter tropicus]|uniref:Phosphotransferase n=1 Tax=Rubrobacter tropicus TaxID=2653851 RepID=A0A6G8Q7N5_9ACTN|nr:phosphotransferase [Rubrobacter tropicus]QIN82491.1 phosphotransferase [Rubrobacter tropicus]
MIVEPFAADPAFPGLALAGDPDAMRSLFAEHLRPVGETPYEISGCKLFRVRYRKGARCVLQYSLDLHDPVTGAEHTQWVTGVMYASGKAKRKWEKLRKSAPEVPAADPAFEPVSFLPELGMLVEVFPYDRRLPGLPLLMAGPSPEIRAPLLADFGGNWRMTGWHAELVRYRSELGATVGISLCATESATGRTERRRFYAKAYHDDAGEVTSRVLETLKEAAGASETAFVVEGAVAYLDGPRVLLQREVPGATLRDRLLRDEDAEAALRLTAGALAELHTSGVEVPRLHPLQREVVVLERTGRLLRWARPDLAARIDGTVGAVVSELEEVPPAPTHRDLKLDHVLLRDGRAGLIDLDGFAGADPLIDAAGVMAHLRGLPLHFPGFDGTRGEDFERTFAHEYFGRVPEGWRDGLPVHYAGAVLKMAVGFFRRREAGWPAKIEALLHTARDSLAGRIW